MLKTFKQFLLVASIGVFAFGAAGHAALMGTYAVPIAHAEPVCVGVGPSAIAITDSVSDTIPSVGETITYTLNGSIAFTASTTVTVSDQLGSGLTFVSATTSVGTYSNASGTWNLGTLSGTQNVTLAITATVNASAAGTTIFNKPVISFVENTVCTQSQAVTGVSIDVENAPAPTPTSTPAFAITKTADATSTVQGGTVHYTVTVTNTGTATGTNVVANDVLPSGLTFVNATTSQVAYVASSGLWTIGTLAPNATATLQIAALVNATDTVGSTITNTATVASSSASAAITVAAPITTPTSTVGSIEVCKLILNASGTVIDGSAFPGAEFSIPGIATVPSSTPAPVGVLSTSMFTTPLMMNAAIAGSATDNAQCVTYGNLSLGHYYYGQESIVASGSIFAAPKYNDQDTITATSTASVFPYSGELFDSNPSNDGLRNSNSDGDVLLTSARPNRQIIVLNQYLGQTATSTPTSTPTSTVADLSIVKTVDNATPNPGATINYTLTVSALGPATSTDVVATDTLPSGLTFEHATASVGSYATSTNTWTIGDMTANATATLQIAALVNASDTVGQQITNTGIVGETPGLTNNGTPSSSVTVTVTSPVCTSNCGGGPVDASLSVQKAESATSTMPGGAIDYTITATAGGPNPSTGVTVSDLLPSGLTFVSATSSASTTYDLNTGTWTIGTLAPNATATLEIAALVNATGTAGTSITNTATIHESQNLTNTSANTSSSVTVQVGTPSTSGDTADLAIVKTVDNAAPVTGTDVNFMVTVTNNGPDTAQFVYVNDPLPSGLAFINATSSDASATYNMTSGRWETLTLAPNATATLAVEANVTGAAGTQIVNVANVSTTLASEIDPDTSNNSSSVTLNVQSAGCTSNCGGGGGGGGGGGTIYDNPGITKTVDNSTPAAGATIHYTITVTNSGPSSASGVSVSDQLPAGVTFVSASPSEGSYASSTGLWTVGTVGQGATATLGITATVNASDTANQSIVNTATISQTGIAVDSDTTNNSASATITVGGGNGGGGGGGGGGGQVLGASTSTGQVLGASCGLYLTSFIHPIRQSLNDPVQVKKLQMFLNQNLGLSLPVTGFYGPQTIAAVNQFQVKYHTEVLAPWVVLGLPTQFTPTSYVYQTTQRWINLIACPALNLPQPQLKVDNGGE